MIWPVTVLVVVLLFRRQIAGRVGAIRRARLPGGVSLELDALEMEVVRTPELEARRIGVATFEATDDSTRGVLPTDGSFTVAEARVELERALRRLSFAVSRDEEFATRSIEDVLLDLRSRDELSVHVARQAQDFLRLSAAAFSSGLNDEDVVAFHTVGSLLASHINYLTRVASISTAVWGHELWHLVEERGRRDSEGKTVLAAIATILPEVSYDYGLFKDAIHRASLTIDDRNWPRDAAPRFDRLLVTESEFLEVVVFRRNELRRILRLFDRSSWLAYDEQGGHLPDELYYKWPRTWGDIPFNTPVTGHSYRPLLPDVADDLLRAEEAARRMRLVQQAKHTSGR